MNTKIYQQVHTLAIKLMEAAEGDDDPTFDKLYAQLKDLCLENENDVEKNHPVQWETLADFTQDSSEALDIYNTALSCAKALDAQDYLASINYAVALLLSEDKTLDEQGDQAFAAARRASEHAAKCSDVELQKEIAQLLKSLKR